MSKKNFLNKLKDATKSVPFNVNLNDIKKNAAEKVNSIYQQASVNKILSKTKQELAQKQQILKQYSEKVKEFSEATGKQLAKKTQSLKDSASEIQKNINLTQTTNKLKQKIFDYASPIIKQQKIKQQPQPRSLPKPKPKSQPQPNPYNFSVFNIAQRVLQKSQKLQQHFLSNMIAQNTKGMFSKILSSLYWRFLFALCLVTLIYVSPQLIKQIGQISIGYKKLEKQDQEGKKAGPQAQKKN